MSSEFGVENRSQKPEAGNQKLEVRLVWSDEFGAKKCRMHN